MMKRFGLLALALASVSACSPTVPDSAAGVGFGDYDSYQQAREAELQGAPAPEVTVRPPSDATGLAADTTAALEATDPAAPATAVDTTDPAALPVNNPGISDEQDFSAVSSRETIESDRERLERQRAQYEVIAPTALPERTGATGPSIVEYALSTSNSVGEQMYRRSGLRSASASARACARYGSPDVAQQAFLAAGGPQRDRKNLDPDGDGFACHWDPAPFRLARQ